MVTSLIPQVVSNMKFLLQSSRKAVLSLLLIPMLSCTMAQEPSKYALSLDKSIRTGRLPNGFTYYLKPTIDTDNISLRFYVKVGNYNERYSEYQFAHLVEHLGGNEVNQQANAEIEMNEEKFAPNTYAETSKIYTYYHGTFPGNDVKTLMNRLQAYANISKMSMKDSMILKEARCVRQELFSRAKSLALNKSFNNSVYEAAILFDKDGQSPFTNWFTNYDMGGISVTSVREFYHHWYRPDRMGLIITGDIQNLDNLEQQLISLYSKIPIPTEEFEEFNYRPFYLSSSPRFKTVERKEVNRYTGWNEENSEISMFFRVKKFNAKLGTEEKWINEKMYKAMYTMVYIRLRSKGVPSWPTQNGVTIDVDFPDRNYPYFRMPAIKNKAGTERENLQRITSILQEIWENGFTQQEWSNQKQVMLDQINSKDTSSIKYWEKQIENHFVYGEILPAQKTAIAKQWIEKLSLNDINSYLKDNFSVMPDDIYITASAGHPALSLTEKQVRGWIKESIKNPVELKETINITSLTPVNEINSPLMSPNEVKNLKEVGYRKTGIDPDNGSEVLELDNGVKIIFDQHEPKSNGSKSISIRGSSPRGASCFPKENYYSAISATEIVKLSGTGSFNRKTILNKLGGGFPRNFEPVQLHIQNNTSTVRVKANIEDIEKYLQLVYLYFTSTRKDSLAFSEWQIQTRKRYFMESSPVNPRADLKNAIADFLDVSAFKSPTYLMSTEQFHKKQNVKLEKAMKCYQGIFGNAFDFTFVVKGAYTKEEILPLFQKYLGNLPSNNNVICSTSDSINKTHIKLPKGPIYQTLYADKMDTAYKLYTTWYNLSYVFPISESNWKDRIVLDFINIYLFSKVNYTLRYLKGIGTYSALTEGSYSETDCLYSLAFYVDGLEDELEQIRFECKGMILGILKNGINDNTKNRFLGDPLYLGRYGSTPKLQEKANKYIKSLNAEDFKTVAAKYLKEKNQYEFVFRENKELQ